MLMNSHFHPGKDKDCLGYLQPFGGLQLQNPMISITAKHVAYAHLSVATASELRRGWFVVIREPSNKNEKQTGPQEF